MSSSLDRLAAGCVQASFLGPVAPAWVLSSLEAGLGGICLFATNVSDSLRTLTDALHGANPEAVLALDEEGGDVTRLERATGSSWPGNAALGAVDDLSATFESAARIGRALREVGVDLDFAPCVDVNRDPANPVIGVRSFGASPDLVARHSAAYVRGLQSAGVAACAKHFPGHGATAEDSHVGLPTVSDPASVVSAEDLPPFVAAIEAGVASIMSAHVVLTSFDPVFPATCSPTVLTGLLRDTLGFRGAAVSDALDMAGVARRYGVPGAAVRSVAAGADLLCLGPAVSPDGVAAVIAALVEAVKSGELAEERLVEAASRRGAIRAVVASPAPGEPGPDGLDTARRAVRVRRPLPPLRGAYLVELDPAPMVAAGPMPWGVPLPDLDASATRTKISSPEEADDVLAAAAGRPLVVVARDLHRHVWQQETWAALRSARPDAVLVEMGWPTSDEPHVLTYGAGRVNGLAAAEVLYAAS